MERRVGSFIWNTRKETENIRKHGVNFETAADAFKDPNQVIFIDEKHSQTEERYFCLGKVAGRIMTVRFTYRQGFIRIIGAGYWREGRRYYYDQTSH